MTVPIDDPLEAKRAAALPIAVSTERIETDIGRKSSAVAESEEPTMVIHQQPDIETLSQKTTPQRSRRGPVIAFTVVVVILAAVGIAFVSFGG